MKFVLSKSIENHWAESSEHENFVTNEIVEFKIEDVRSEKKTLQQTIAYLFMRWNVHKNFGNYDVCVNYFYPQNGILVIRPFHWIQLLTWVIWFLWYEFKFMQNKVAMFIVYAWFDQQTVNWQFDPLIYFLFTLFVIVDLVFLSIFTFILLPSPTLVCMVVAKILLRFENHAVDERFKWSKFYWPSYTKHMEFAIKHAQSHNKCDLKYFFIQNNSFVFNTNFQESSSDTIA